MHPLMRPLSLLTGTLAIATAMMAGPAAAQTPSADPSRMTIIVSAAAGGLTDMLARLTAKALEHDLRIPVIVENRPGANGVLGMTALAHAAPDGTTIGVVPASVMTVNPFLYTDMKIDTVKDFTPLGLAITVPNVLVVNPSVPATDVNALLAWIRKQPNLTYGSMGPGSSAHLNGELLQRNANVAMNHVPYKGSAPVMQDLVAGNIQMAFENLPVALPLIQAGKLRAIGVTSTAPSPQLPGVPPIGQTITGFEDNIWFGFIAPAGLPDALATRLNQALVRAVQSDEVASQMKTRGATISPSSREKMRDVIAADRAKWQKLIAERGLSIR